MEFELPTGRNGGLSTSGIERCRNGFERVDHAYRDRQVVEVIAIENTLAHSSVPK